MVRRLIFTDLLTCVINSTPAWSLLSIGREPRDRDVPFEIIGNMKCVAQSETAALVHSARGNRFFAILLQAHCLAKRVWKLEPNTFVAESSGKNLKYELIKFFGEPEQSV